jgi:hypothetical protein
MQRFIVGVHEWWVNLDPVWQAIIIGLIAVVYQFTVGYNFVLPTTWNEAATEGATYAMALGAVVWLYFTQEVWPNLVRLLMAAFAIQSGTEVAVTRRGVQKRVVHWAPATV